MKKLTKLSRSRKPLKCKGNFRQTLTKLTKSYEKLMSGKKFSLEAKNLLTAHLRRAIKGHQRRKRDRSKDMTKNIETASGRKSRKRFKRVMRDAIRVVRSIKAENNNSPALCPANSAIVMRHAQRIAGFKVTGR